MRIKSGSSSSSPIASLDVGASLQPDLRVRVLRNGAINFIAALLPLLVGIAAIPRIVRGLGVDQFGILSFAWALLGYFTFFDFGLGRATTKFVAERVGRGDVERLSYLIWSSVAASAVLGVVGAIVLAAVTPALVGHVLAIPPSLVPDTREVFFVLASTLPAVLMSNTFRGVLEAHHRFGLVACVTVPASVSTFVLPAAGAMAGLHLPGIVLLLAAARFSATGAFLWMCLADIPELRRPGLDRNAIKPLIKFGGWVTVSNIVGPSLTYFDRFAIGSQLSTAALGYYTAPYEAVTRLWIFPSSIVSALFPAFSATAARGAAAEIGKLAGSAIKYLLMLVSPIVTVIVAFAPVILGLWLGSEFAVRSAPVLQLLAIGVLVNSAAFVPFSLLQALGRADLPPKLYAIELIVYVPVLFVLLRQFGITGAAAAWTIRVAFDWVLLSVACQTICSGYFPSLVRHGVVRAMCAVVALGTGAACVMSIATGSLPLRAASIAVLLVAFAISGWHFLLAPEERRRLAVLTQARPSGAGIR